MKERLELFRERYEILTFIQLEFGKPGNCDER